MGIANHLKLTPLSVLGKFFEFDRVGKQLTNKTKKMQWENHLNMFSMTEERENYIIWLLQKIVVYAKIDFRTLNILLYALSFFIVGLLVCCDFSNTRKKSESPLLQQPHPS